MSPANCLTADIFLFLSFNFNQLPKHFLPCSVVLANIQCMEILQQYFTAARKVTKEFNDEPLPVVQGEIPPKLEGTLFRNGNGRFEHQGVWYNHLFDGDGMVCAFTFANGQVRYRNRYVRTQEFVREEAAGKMLYRSFGTNIPGGIWTNFLKMRFKNAANTSVIWHGGKLLALWEGGLPHELDPATLETIERYDYDGVLQNDFSWLDHQITPELPFSAHPKLHPDTQVLHNFGTAPGTKQRLLLYEVQPNGRARISQSIEIPEVIFTHDFILTKSGYKIFFLTPVSFELWKAFVGLESPVDSIRVHKDQPTKVLVVTPNGQVENYTTEFGFVFHYINGFEIDRENLAIDALMMPDFPNAGGIQRFVNGEQADTPQASVVRYVINRQKKTVERTQITDFQAELPSIHPEYTGKHYQYAWTIGRSPAQASPLLDDVIKINVQNGKALATGWQNSLPSEPIMVPRPGARAEDDGWLLYLIFDYEAKATKLIVADAKSLKILAQAPLPHHIPLGFHGSWVPQVF